MQFCNDAIDERAIRLLSNGRKRNASLTTRAFDKEAPDIIRSKGQTFVKLVFF